MEENKISKILLPSTITSNLSINKNELLEPNLPKEHALIGIVKQEYSYTWPYELQLKSKKPEVKVENVDDEDEISIKHEPLISEELHIKDENAPTVQPMETNIESGYYYCGFCNHKYSDKNSLELHINPESKPLECYKCLQKCMLEAHINSHLATKGNDLQHNKYSCCTICDYKCVRKDNLKQHMKTHTGEKPFNCDICDYKTGQRSTLIQHVRTHTGEKPFKCAACDYRSAQKGALQRHMKSHTGENLLLVLLVIIKVYEREHYKDI